MNHRLTFLFLLVFLAACNKINPSSVKSFENSRIRIITSGEGYFQVSKEECIQQGFDWGNAENLQLSYRGEAYPFWFENPEKLTLGFYAPPVKDINLVDNVFILSNDQPDVRRQFDLHQLEVGTTKEENGSKGVYHFVIEPQKLYLPQIAGQDHWVWEMLTPGEQIENEFEIPVFPGAQAIVKIRIWNPASQNNGDKSKVNISINNHHFTIFVMAMHGWQEINLEIDRQVLKMKNSIQLSYELFPGEIPKKIYLDRIEVVFSTVIELGDKVQSFFTGDNQIHLNVLNPGTLISFDQNNLPAKVYSVQTTGNAYLHQELGAYYSWIPTGNFSLATEILPAAEFTFDEDWNAAELLIIAPEEFHQTLNPFIEFKKKQGLNTLIVSPQKIYDFYDSGFPSSEVLKKFIQKAWILGEGHLKYLLLIGDYSYAPVTYQDFVRFVPSVFIDSNSTGQTISDFRFGDINEDQIPELAVGRVPARTAEQLEVWIKKVIDYERAIPDNWYQIGAIADSSDPVYGSVAQEFLDRKKSKVPTKFYNSHNFTVLSDFFSTPYSLILYFGHGSIDLWGKGKILSTEKVRDLPDVAGAPVILDFSCLNGYFIHPEKESLAEALLFQPEGGAVGIYTFGAQSLLEDQINLIQLLEGIIQAPRQSRIGDFLFFLNNEKDKDHLLLSDILDTGIYFGDPSMDIP